MVSESRIAILGSTGSIGRNAVEVAQSIPGCTVVGITCHSQKELLIQQARELKPRFAVISGASKGEGFDFPNMDAVQFQFGGAAIQDLVSQPEVDTVIAAIVGRAGLESTWSAAENGKRIALANKESLVLAGKQITELVGKNNSELLPVDSEHSAIFQCLQSGTTNEVQRIILTASGGPFLDFTNEQLRCATVEQALSHPTWDMGKKITVDSATMMNKALEVVEARWLFDISPEKIAVIIHPQSIIHSMVEYCDGSVIAQMSPPDMKLPIQYALTYPNRVDGCSPKLDLTQIQQLELRPADFEQFPALKLGFEVAQRGGTTGAVLNAANEAAVEAFLNRQISFIDIVAACREILDNHNFDPNPNLETLIAQDVWAREEINKWIAC